MRNLLAAGMLVVLLLNATGILAQNVPVHASLLNAVEDSSSIASDSNLISPSSDASLSAKTGFAHGALAETRKSSPSSWDFFVADSRWNPYGTVNGVGFSPLSQGIVGSVTHYFDHNLGFELRGNAQNPSLREGSNGGAVGPVYRFAVRFSPTIHALVGAQHFVGPMVPTYSGTSYYGNAPVWAATVSIGMSGDISLPKTGKHLALRMDASYQYFHASYGPVEGPTYGGQVNVNAYSLNPGLVFRFGHANGGDWHPQKAKK